MILVSCYLLPSPYFPSFRTEKSPRSILIPVTNLDPSSPKFIPALPFQIIELKHPFGYSTHCLSQINTDLDQLQVS